MNVKVELLSFSGQPLSGELYLTWTPTKVRITVDAGTREVTLSSRKRSGIETPKFPNPICVERTSSPSLLFYTEDNSTNIKGKQELKLTFNEDEGFKDIYVGGKFDPHMLYNGASVEQPDIDVLVNDIVVNHAMIRVRKNANELSEKAIEDFINAINVVNKRDEEGRGIGIYSTDFFNMHIKKSKSIAHGTPVFLPWHRLYILDLERSLQKVNPYVTLPYWDFDNDLKYILSEKFLGHTLITDPTTTPSYHGFCRTFATYYLEHKLDNWAVNGEKLVRRIAKFDYKTKSNSVLDENQTIKIDTYLSRYTEKFDEEDGNLKLKNIGFTSMEGNPHGASHDSMIGYLNYVPTATKDPLFFLLHCNVDRLWAKWQTTSRIENQKDQQFYNEGSRYDSNDVRTYPYVNSKSKLPTSESWMYIDQKIWPWNGKPTPNDYDYLPPQGRIGNFTESKIVKNFNDNQPIIKDAIDPFGVDLLENNLGFAYDDNDAFNSHLKTKTKLNEEELLETLTNSNLNNNKGISEILVELENLISNKTLGNTKENVNPKITDISKVIDDLILTQISDPEFGKHSPKIKDLLKEYFKLIKKQIINDDLELKPGSVNVKTVIDQITIFLCQEDDEFMLELVKINVESLISQWEQNPLINFTRIWFTDSLIYSLALKESKYISQSDLQKILDNILKYLFVDQEPSLNLLKGKVMSNSECGLDFLITVISFLENSRIVKSFHKVGLFVDDEKINEKLNISVSPSISATHGRELISLIKMEGYPNLKRLLENLPKNAITENKLDALGSLIYYALKSKK